MGAAPKRLAAGLTVMALVLALTTVVAPRPAGAEDNGTEPHPSHGLEQLELPAPPAPPPRTSKRGPGPGDQRTGPDGYQYVNLDDFWYVCPGSQGPEVDPWGRWATNDQAFPPGPAGENGIKVVADYVHRLGLKFGIYVTPGISKQALAADTPVLAEAARRATGRTRSPNRRTRSTTTTAVGWSASTTGPPGAQEFINSWADEFAAWGADYVKLDGVGSFDIADVEAWSRALRQTGRPMHLELSNALNIKYGPTWEAYSNGWRTTDDIECYACEDNGSSYPLTDWANVSSRFAAVADWQPYGQPGGFNDYDSIEVGNGTKDGLTSPNARRS